MSVCAEVLQGHIAYTAWASRQLVQAAAQLTQHELDRNFGTADRSVFGTLYHVFAADSVWLSRVQGISPSAFPRQGESSFSSLEVMFVAVHQGWTEWAAKLRDDSSSTEISYVDLKGNAYTQPIWQIVLHVVNHGTHHRGQVSGFLRTMGHTPPVLDFTFYQRRKL